MSKRLEDRLIELTSLEDGWKDGEGLMVTRAAVVKAMPLAYSLTDDISLFPTLCGGLQFEGPGFEIEISSFGTTRYETSDDEMTGTPENPDIVDHLLSGIDNADRDPKTGDRELGGVLLTMRDAAHEIAMLRQVVTRYCDKSRMGTIEPMEVQQAADRAFEFTK